MLDPERVLDALEKSTETRTTVIGQVRGLERRVDTLQDNLSTQMHDLEQEMGTMNAHLDNLVREVQTSNGHLQRMAEDTQAERERRERLEAAEREREREIQDDTRAMVKKGIAEVWGVVKQPLGYLIAGVFAWVAFHYFYVPPQVVPAAGASSEQDAPP